MYYYERYYFYRSLSVVGLMISRTLGLIEHSFQLGDIRNAYEKFVWN